MFPFPVIISVQFIYDNLLYTIYLLRFIVYNLFITIYCINFNKTYLLYTIYLQDSRVSSSSELRPGDTPLNIQVNWNNCWIEYGVTISMVFSKKTCDVFIFLNYIF